MNKIYIRHKPRQSGKTTELLELSEILLSLGRKVAYIVKSDRDLQIIKKNEKKKLDELAIKYNTNIWFLSASSFELGTRGIRLDTVLIDDIDLLDIRYFNSIQQYPLNINIYATSSKN